VRLLHPLSAHFMRLSDAVGVHLALVLRLHPITVDLLPARHSILGVAVAVLMLDRLRLHPAVTVLSLALHPDMRRMLLPLDSGKALAVLGSRHRKPLTVHGMAASTAASASELLDVTAPAAVVAATAATRGEHRVTAATAVVAATAATAVVLMRPLVTLAPAVRARASRGCDRERGDAGCEKHPGHEEISFRTAKTARPLHRSNP
jgi:hypothetical protein